MRCHLRFAVVVTTVAVLVSSVSASAEADPDPNPESKPPKLPPPSESLLFEHRSAKPEPFLDRLASALFGTRYSIKRWHDAPLWGRYRLTVEGKSLLWLNTSGKRLLFLLLFYCIETTDELKNIYKLNGLKSLKSH